VQYNTSGSAATAAGGPGVQASGTAAGGVDLLSGLLDAATASADPKQQQQGQQKRQAPDLLMQLDDDGPPPPTSNSQQAPHPSSSVDMLMDLGPTQLLGPAQPSLVSPALSPPAPHLAAASMPQQQGQPLPMMFNDQPQHFGAGSGADFATHHPQQQQQQQQQQLGQYGLSAGFSLGGGLGSSSMDAGMSGRDKKPVGQQGVSKGPGPSMVPNKHGASQKANADPFSDLLG